MNVNWPRRISVTRNNVAVELVQGDLASRSNSKTQHSVFVPKDDLPIQSIMGFLGAKQAEIILRREFRQICVDSTKDNVNEKGEINIPEFVKDIQSLDAQRTGEFAKYRALRDEKNSLMDKIADDKTTPQELLAYTDRKSVV